LVVMNRDGSNNGYIFKDRTITSDSYAPAWSPDGKMIVFSIVQPTKDSIGGFDVVDVATGNESKSAVGKGRLFFEPVWMKDGRGLIVPSADLSSGPLQAQLGYLSFPGNDYRLLTHDTNDYSHASIAADGKTMVANQTKLNFQLAVAPADAPSQIKPVSLSSQASLWRWGWAADGKLLLPQSGDIKAVTLDGQETTVLHDTTHVSDEVNACGDGKTVIVRRVNRSGASMVNLWRMDLSGNSISQLTAGQNEREPACSADGKWVYFIDQADNASVKRVPTSGGTPETIVKSPIGDFALSPDGKTISSVEVAEDDHKLMIRVDPTDGGKTNYVDADSRMRGTPVISPDGKALIYVMRDKGVDNLWSQSLDGKNRKQLTNFTSDLILRYAYSKDGKQIAMERGNLESDAFLFRDTTK